MNVFADSAYWVATINKRDSYHAAAEEARESLGNVILVTSDEVLIEVLNSFARKGKNLRGLAAEAFRAIQENPNVEVVPQTRESLRKGFELYCQRNDKEYGLTDCITMCTMRERGIAKVLTTDKHFSQEGFEVLMPVQ